MFLLPTPPGFQGLRLDRPITSYHRNLPHWRQDGATYFVTFRLNDSLPQGKLSELREIRRTWERRHPVPQADRELEELSRMLTTSQEKWLDLGHGECLLASRADREVVVGALHHFDEGAESGDGRYQLGAYVVMPNHVHIIVRPNVEKATLEEILQSWKRFTARRINKARNRVGALWFEESFDRIVRDTEHLYRCVQYIGSNPSKATLSEDESERWIRPEWRELGWEFDRDLMS